MRALHLEAWADSLDARASLPQLVRRLIRATGKDIRRIEFPADEQVQRPGWDGIVEAGDGDVYVPAGTSVWEMGVDKNPQKKGRGGFRQAHERPPRSRPDENDVRIRHAPEVAEPHPVRCLLDTYAARWHRYRWHEAAADRTAAHPNAARHVRQLRLKSRQRTRALYPS